MNSPNKLKSVSIISQIGYSNGDKNVRGSTNNLDNQSEINDNNINVENKSNDNSVDISAVALNNHRKLVV